MLKRLVIAPVFALAVLLSGCDFMETHMQTHEPTPVAVTGPVTEMPTFERFIDTHPTPDQFRARYPDVVLILPGTMATREYRHDNSRYFAELDKDGHITGGKFM